MRVRASAVSGSAVGGLLLAVALTGAAWACTAAPATNALSVGAGPAGSEVVVSGANFASVTTPVEIRWNSVTGPLLATAQAPSFSVPVVVPSDAAPGMYYIVAVARANDSSIAAKVGQVFEVTPTPGAPAHATGPVSAQAVVSDPWAGFSNTNLSPFPTGVEPSGAGGRTPGATAGVALLAVGLVAISSGVLSAELRRRRVTTSSNG